jgi:hypothetical protein
MSDRSPSSSDPGFVPFRASTALAGARPPEDASAAPPPLPPPPPGVASRGARPDPAAGRPPPPAVPAPGTERGEAWRQLLGWCAAAGLANGGLLARRDGTIVEQHGAPPLEDAALLARRLCTALAAAREAGGYEAAAALDLGRAWITGFAVPTPGGAELVAGIWGSAPLRASLRAPLARWVADALARTD